MTWQRTVFHVLALSIAGIAGAVTGSACYWAMGRHGLAASIPLSLVIAYVIGTLLGKADVLDDYLSQQRTRRSER